MSDEAQQPEAVRCARCHEEWKLGVNLLDDALIWTPPKRKRGGCQHPATEIEFMNADREWVEPAGVQS